MDYPRQLPIVTYEGKKWFFDERLKQLRTVTHSPSDKLEFQDLNDFEVQFFVDKTKTVEEKKMKISNFMQSDDNLRNAIKRILC